MDRERQGGRQPDVRASDADRDDTIATLRRHHVDGRLDWEEFSERLDRASRARTREELRELLTDLPPAAEPSAPTGPAAPPPAGTRPAGAGWSRGWWWRPWLVPPVVALAVLAGLVLGAWAFGGPGPYHRGFFFPIFPLLFWGFLLARIILPRRRWRRW